MFPVFANSSGQGFGFEEFCENLIQICDHHQHENRALAFALIIDDYESPHVEKILLYKEYWNSLHQISGSKLTVFSIVRSSINIQVAEHLARPIKMEFKAMTRVTAGQDIQMPYI